MRPATDADMKNLKTHSSKWRAVIAACPCVLVIGEDFEPGGMSRVRSSLNAVGRYTGMPVRINKLATGDLLITRKDAP